MNSAARLMLPQLTRLLLAGIVGLLLTGSAVVASVQLKIKFVGMHGDRAKFSVDRGIELVKSGATVKKGWVTLMSPSKSQVIFSDRRFELSIQAKALERLASAKRGGARSQP